jgi:Uma2 family endonuclease
MTEEEYLAFEEHAEERHEFVNGELVPIEGVSDAHDRIQVNLTIALGVRLRGTPCRPRAANMRVRLDETGLYAYPDMTIVCGEAQFAPTRPVSLLNPKVVIEVLSESPADYDCGSKAAHYRHRASVQTILLVDSRRRMVERQDRNPDDTWTLAELTTGDVRVLDITVPIDEIYDTVSFEA